MKDNELVIGQIVYYNSVKAKGIRVSEIGYVVNYNEDPEKVDIMIKGRNKVFDAFKSMLSKEPKGNLINISRSNIEEYKAQIPQLI